MSELTNPSNQPANLEWTDHKQAIQITWKDGHVSTFRLSYLREICPCAGCRGTPEAPPLSSAPRPRKLPVVSDREASENRARTTARRSFPVGNYAIGLEWADGHKDGIFSFSYLREMCPDAAKAEATRDGEPDPPC